MEKFPDHVDAPSVANGSARDPSPRPQSHGTANGNSSALLSGRSMPMPMPMPRRDDGHGASLAWSASSNGRNRQKSLSNAFRNIRARNGSMSQNAHEIADALRAPVSPKLVVRLPDRPCSSR